MVWIPFFEPRCRKARKDEDARQRAAEAAARQRAAEALVEGFDIEPFSDFSAKKANFIGLVLFCIDAKFCKKLFVGKLLTRSTRFTSPRA